MTLAEMRSRVLRRLDEDDTSPVYYTKAEVEAMINRAHRLFAVLTLAPEKTGQIALSANQYAYDLPTLFPDLLVVLRASIDGKKLRPGNLPSFSSANESWRAARGDPTYYAVAGYRRLFITPAPTGSGLNMDVTYAYVPALMTSDSATPSIPEPYHPYLIDLAVPFLRVKEGGDELAGALGYLAAGMDGLASLARRIAEMRRRPFYDQQPVELDRRRLELLIREILTQAKPAVR